MRYVSDDDKVFNTEQECYEYEQQIRRLRAEEERNKEKLAEERKKMMKKICQKRKELQELTETYQNKFGIVIEEYLPFGEFLRILYR